MRFATFDKTNLSTLCNYIISDNHISVEPPCGNKSHSKIHKLSLSTLAICNIYYKIEQDIPT